VIRYKDIRYDHRPAYHSSEQMFIATVTCIDLLPARIRRALI